VQPNRVTQVISNRLRTPRRTLICGHSWEKISGQFGVYCLVGICTRVFSLPPSLHLSDLSGFFPPLLSKIIESVASDTSGVLAVKGKVLSQRVTQTQGSRRQRRHKLLAAAGVRCVAGGASRASLRTHVTGWQTGAAGVTGGNKRRPFTTPVTRGSSVCAPFWCLATCWSSQRQRT